MGPLKAMQQWASDGQMGSHSRRQKQLSRLLMSLQVAPWSADRHMDLARFYTWHMRRTTRRSEQHQIYAQRTQQQLLAAVQQRPVWGLAWAALAENSVASGHYKPVIEGFLSRALRLGPYEPGTLRKIALVGMLHWSNLCPALRGAVRKVVRRSLQIDDHPATLIRLAFSLQWQDQLQDLLQAPSQRAEFERLSRRQGS